MFKPVSMLGALPELMDSMKNQESSLKAKASLGPAGKRSSVGLPRRNPRPGPMGKRTGPPPAPKMPGGSFYEQTLSRKPGVGLIGALPPALMRGGGIGPGGMINKHTLGLGGPMGHRSTYKWDRTAREGTESHQSPF